MWSFAAICWLKPFTASTAKPVKFILLTSKNVNLRLETVEELKVFV